MRNINTSYLFVYGTLKRGFKIKTTLTLKKISTYIDNGCVHGMLYSVSNYPAITHLHSRSIVKGELLKLKNINIALHLLDLYEQAFVGEKEYKRTLTLVKTSSKTNALAHIYIYNHSTTGLTKIPQGVFRSKQTHYFF